MGEQSKRPDAEGGFWGIFRRPYLDLSPLLDLSGLDEIHEEICLGLCEIEPEYTGGSLKWMGVCPRDVVDDPYIDYGHVLSTLDEEGFRRFVSLAENPRIFDPKKRQAYRFGDETPNPLTREQALYLKYRHGVYFPWKVAYHLLENDLWEDKHRGAGKRFRDEARELFPRTVACIEALPFREIGRCLIFGLEANDHAPIHQDTEPGEAEVGHTITLCPRADKGFFLRSTAGQRLEVKARAYWFNDMDEHGVEARPYFRYSIRVDGVFEPEFYRRLRDFYGAPPLSPAGG